MALAEYDVARTLEDVVGAWRVAYNAYARRGLIDSNPFGLFAVLEAISTDTAIIVERNGAVIRSAVTATLDGPHGLPLDSVFAEELAALRATGRRLLEIGLFASDATGSDSAWSSRIGDRGWERVTADRNSCARSRLLAFDDEMDPSFFEDKARGDRRNLFKALGLSFQFGRNASCTDFLCAMHPDRTTLYRRLFGMEPFGITRAYDAMNGQPAQLMRGKYEVALNSPRIDRRAAIGRRPVAARFFEGRYHLDLHGLADSPVADFVAYLLQQAAARRSP